MKRRKAKDVVGTSIKLERDIHEWITEEAERDGRSINNIINLLLRLHIMKTEKDNHETKFQAK